MRIVDLSYEIADGMPVYPGDDNVSLKQTKFLSSDSYNAFVLLSGMHSGTHIDIPSHMANDQKSVSDFEIDRFIGNGVLLDVCGENVIKYKPEYNSMIEMNDIVLLRTGFADMYNNPETYYNNYPVVDYDLCEFFISKKIKFLGIDAPAPDKEPYEIHKRLFENDIFILENLTNLHELVGVEKFEVFAVPIKIKAEASLVRAFARID